MIQGSVSARSAVAIPAFNEEASIVSVIRAAQTHVDEVIVVDDGSADQTAIRAAEAGAVVIRHDHNHGKAKALMTAFHVAANRGIDVLVLIDGDGQHDPAEIPRLLDPIASGTADVVVGSRFLDIRNPTPFYRSIGQRVLNVATHLCSGVRCSDSQCGYRALNRLAFTSIQLTESYLHGLAAESEMQFEIATHRLRLVEVPVYVRYDNRARRSPVKHGFGVLYRVMSMAAQRRNRRGLAAPVAPADAAAEVTSHSVSD